jgi:hypothetical protein
LKNLRPEVRQQYREVFGTLTLPGAAVPPRRGQAATLRTALENNADLIFIGLEEIIKREFYKTY